MADLLVGLGTEECQCGYCEWTAGAFAPAWKERPLAHYVAARLIQVATMWVALAGEAEPYSVRAAGCMHIATQHAQGAKAGYTLTRRETREQIRALIAESQGLQK